MMTCISPLFLFLSSCSPSNQDVKNSKAEQILQDTTIVVEKTVSAKSDLVKMKINGDVVQIEMNEIGGEGDNIGHYYFNSRGLIDSIIVNDQSSDYQLKTYNSYNNVGVIIGKTVYSKIGGTTYTSLSKFDAEGDEVKMTTTNDGGFPVSVVNTAKTDSGFYSVQITKGKNSSESKKHETIRNLNYELIEMNSYTYQKQVEKLVSRTVYTYDEKGLQTSSKGFWGDSTSLEVATNTYDSESNLIAVSAEYPNNKNYPTTEFEYKYDTDSLGNWVSKTVMVSGKTVQTFYRKFEYR
jgi:hypothetical protein